MIQFLFLLILGCLFSTGCTSSSLRGEKTSAAQHDLKIIDAHMHTRFRGKPNRFSGIMDTQESLLKEMADNQVIGGVVHTRSGDDGYTDLLSHNIIHCAGVDGEPNLKFLENGLKTKKFRCMKIYLGYVAQYATDRRYQPVYKLAEKYGVPVVFHTGDTSDKTALVKYSEPMDIDEVAVKNPKVIFVIAHLGNPWVNTAAEIVYKNSNVYADVSAFLVGDLAEVPPEKIETYLVAPIRWAFGYIEDPTKLMYGTDWPLTGMKTYIAAIKKAIPREHWNDVFYNNAQRVFKIPSLPPAP